MARGSAESSAVLTKAISGSRSNDSEQARMKVLRLFSFGPRVTDAATRARGNRSDRVNTVLADIRAAVRTLSFGRMRGLIHDCPAEQRRMPVGHTWNSGVASSRAVVEQVRISHRSGGDLAAGSRFKQKTTFASALWCNVTLKGVLAVAVLDLGRQFIAPCASVEG